MWFIDDDDGTEISLGSCMRSGEEPFCVVSLNFISTLENNLMCVWSLTLQWKVAEVKILLFKKSNIM